MPKDWTLVGFWLVKTVWAASISHLVSMSLSPTLGRKAVSHSKQCPNTYHVKYSLCKVKAPGTCATVSAKKPLKGNALLTGPNLHNSLLGVLIRFRKEAVAITTDIKQMFHCFVVRAQDRNFLRFFWYQDNDESKNIIEFRMKVHVAAPQPFMVSDKRREGETEDGADIREFVGERFLC